MKNGIYTPIGGFMNHIRWLCLLDDSYKFISLNKDSYISFKGADWPELQEVLEDPVSAIKSQFFNEIINLCDGIPFYCPIDQKINFILENVYTKDRTWHNWLIYEWKYRVALNYQLFAEHNYTKNENIDRQLICTCDPELSYKSYLKFNINLNNTTKESFLEMQNRYSNGLHLLKKPYKILDSTILFQKSLDRSFYNEMIEWFKLEDNYDAAQIIHSAWYDGHKRAEKEIVEDLKKIYKDS